MRKIIGFSIIVVSIVVGVFLHDRYLQMLLKEEQRAAQGKQRAEALQFLNDYILPPTWPGDAVPVGGLSGLSWLELDETLFAVSDDRGRSGPSRFYELKIQKSDDTPYAVAVKAVHFVKDEKGQQFPARNLDLEGIAVDSSGWVYVSSEGDFKETKEAVPLLMKMNRQGKAEFRMEFGELFFPKEESRQNVDFGVRYNLAFETLNIHAATKQMVTTTESALIQDGPVSDFKTGTRIRFSFYQITDSEIPLSIAQHVYPLSPIPGQTEVADSTVGVTDAILFRDKKLLVLERAYLGARAKNRVKLFLADCSQASDVRALRSLLEQASLFKECEKTEVYDFDLLIGSLSEEHPRVDNIEGLALGPKLDDGHHLLVFVSDNNFNDKQKTQFLFFKVNLSKLDLTL
jgi:hypothetical protein